MRNIRDAVTKNILEKFKNFKKLKIMPKISKIKIRLKGLKKSHKILDSTKVIFKFKDNLIHSVFFQNSSQFCLAVVC